MNSGYFKHWKMNQSPVLVNPSSMNGPSSQKNSKITFELCFISGEVYDFMCRLPAGKTSWHVFQVSDLDKLLWEFESPMHLGPTLTILNRGQAQDSE